MIKMNNGAKVLKVFLQTTEDDSIQQPHGVALCEALGNKLVVWNVFAHHASGHAAPGLEAQYGAYFDLKSQDKTSLHYRGVFQEATREFSLRVSTISRKL